MTEPGIELWSPGPLANILLIKPIKYYWLNQPSRLMCVECPDCRGIKLPTSGLDMTLDNLIVMHPSWSFGECGVPLPFHYSSVHTDLEKSYLLVSSSGPIELLVLDSNTWNHLTVSKQIFLHFSKMKLPTNYSLIDYMYIPLTMGKQGLIIFTNPSARAGYDTRSIFKRSVTGLNSEFSFS